MGSWFSHILSPQGLHRTESIWKKNCLVSMEKVARLEKSMPCSVRILLHEPYLLFSWWEEQWDHTSLLWRGCSVVPDITINNCVGDIGCGQGQQRTVVPCGLRKGSLGWWHLSVIRNIGFCPQMMTFTGIMFTPFPNIENYLKKIVTEDKLPTHRAPLFFPITPEHYSQLA